MPHLKIFRVMAALYPQGMTTVAATGHLQKLVRKMGAADGLSPVERHVWVRQRIDEVLGPVADEADALAVRMSLAWSLYAQYVQPPPGGPDGPTPPRLLPLPPARRRRGLTAIRGLFPAVLSTLEFVRDGVTRAELLDFLRAGSPDAQTSSLRVTINVLKSELAVIQTDGDRCTLTERGEDVLESQDASHLADWLLTRILGVDKALIELRDRGPLPPSELMATVQTMNPGWTATFVPQAILSWLRSMGAIETTQDYRHVLTAKGRDWVEMIHWEPECASAGSGDCR